MHLGLTAVILTRYVVPDGNGNRDDTYEFVTLHKRSGIAYITKRLEHT
jgi:hypothetical protein